MPEPLLPIYGARQRRRQPAPLIPVPPEMHKSLFTNDLECCHETVIDGNCGIHSFSLSLRAEGLRNKRLSATNAYKTFLQHNADADAIVPLLLL
jgi:hypothetical protein